MQKLAQQLGFLSQRSRGELLRFQRHLSKKLLQEPMFADFAELERESASLRA